MMVTMIMSFKFILIKLFFYVELLQNVGSLNINKRCELGGQECRTLNILPQLLLISQCD